MYKQNASPVKAFCKLKNLFLNTVIICGLLLFTVNLSAQKINFKASKRYIDAGQTTTLTWNVKFAGSKALIKLSDTDTYLKKKGSMEISPENDTQYTLTVKGKFGEEKKNIKVKVRKPEIIYFTGPENNDGASHCELKWKTRFAKTIEIEGHDAYLPAIGSKIMVPTATTEYTLKVCNKYDYCVSSKIKIDFNGDFAKGPTSLSYGESGLLEWKFENAINVAIEGADNNLPAEGSKKISPSTSTNYTFLVKKKTDELRDTIISKTVTVPVVRNNYIKDVKEYVTLPSGRRLMFDIFSVNWQNYPNEIRLKIMITDSIGNYITGMAPPKISEKESREFFKTIIETVEGQRYPINDFKVTEIRSMTSTPHDIAMVLDYSGSMNSSFDKLDKATQNFIRKKNPEDRIGVVRFDDAIGVEAQLEKNPKDLLSKIAFNKGANYGGGTALYAAAGAGMQLLNDSMRSRQLILMTDGYENSSMFYWGTYYTFASEVIANARKNQVTINTIDFMGYANTPLLEALANMSGGKYYQLRKVKDIEEVFVELQHLYHNYYEVVYTPAPQKGNRTIELVYNDNANQFASTTAKAYVDDNINIEAIEKEEVSNVTMLNRSSVLGRQTVALFDFNKADIEAVAQKKLDRIVAYMKSNTEYKIIIRGHSDLKGDDVYCKRISDARALAVSNYLRKNGIPASRIKYEGKAKTDPIWTVEDEAWKARENRRVDIELVKK